MPAINIEIFEADCYFCCLLTPAWDQNFLPTTSVPCYPSFSTVLRCDVRKTECTIILGFDWAALLREDHLGRGYRLGSSFNAWILFSPPSHPIGKWATLSDVPSPDSPSSSGVSVQTADRTIGQVGDGGYRGPDDVK
ncbi:hypothetical protein B0H19DRAFT_1229258 [Mycena capillaripes]|nr:hypothetical protein B0H19DRAFT_1229258 [Mycena capillaripes]